MEALNTYKAEKTLAEQMNERLAELKMTKAEAALKMNYSRSALSQYLNGKYGSDPTELEKKIMEFLEASGGIVEGRGQENIQAGAGILKKKVEFFESRDFVQTIGVCQACQQDMGLGIIVGKSGQGKTHALKKYAELPRVAYIECIAVGGTWMCKSDKIKAGAWDEITAMSKEAVNVMLGLELGHIGINCADEAEAAKTAETIGSLLSMAVKPGNSSIFVGKKEFEIMKKPGRGTHGHIAILTNNVDRAIYHLSQRGVKFDMDSKNVKDGKTIAIYFADEVAGFAIHLVQK